MNVSPTLANTENGESYGRVARRGAVLIGLAQVVKILLQFASVIMLARLLVPEDFGLVASVTPLVSFVTRFQDMGMQQAVIQKKNPTAGLLNRIFWVTLAMGTVCTAGVAALGPAVAQFYGDSRLILLTAATAAPLWFVSLGSLPMGLLQRRMRFKTIAVLDIVGGVLGFAAAVAAAMHGFGYWSLTLQPVVVALVNLMGSLAATRWWPSWPSFWLEREVMGFGAKLTGNNIAIFLARNTDNILIGRFHGSVMLGYYDRAYKLLMFPLYNLNDPMQKVMLPVLSRIQGDKPRFRQIFLRAAGLLALVAVPGVAAVGSVPEAVIHLCFGDRWLSVAPIFAWLSLAGLLLPLNQSAQWIFIAQARTSRLLRLGVFNAITSVAAIVCGLPWGAIGVAAAFAISEFVLRLPVLYWFVRRIGPVRMRDMVGLQFPLLAAAATTKAIVVVWFLDRLKLQGLPLIGATVLVSYSLAVLYSALNPLGRRTFGDVFAMLPAFRIARSARRGAGAA